MKTLTAENVETIFRDCLFRDGEDTSQAKIVEGVVSTTASDWIYVPKASPRPVFELPFRLGEQKVWGFEFVAHQVLAADVASGGALATETYAEGCLLRFGKAA